MSDGKTNGRIERGGRRNGTVVFTYFVEHMPSETLIGV